MFNKYIVITTLLFIINNILIWYQLNSQLVWDWAKTTKSIWFMCLMGVPISYLFFYSTRMFYNYFGDYWSVRPIGFGIATLTFGMMTALILHEVPSQRIIVSLILACVILYINLSVHIK